MYRLVKKVEEGKDLDSNSLAYANKLIKGYTIATIRSMKESLKSLETESVRVDLDDLFNLNRIKGDSPQETTIKSLPSVLEIARMAAFVYNQKAMVALTKEKNRLALQNLVKAITVSSQVVVSTGDLFMHFVLLVNSSFVLFKLDRVSDAISFSNQGLLLGEEALNQLASGNPIAARDCMEAARTYTFAPFFIRGGDNFGTKGKDPNAEQVQQANHRQNDISGSCSLRHISC